MALLQISEPGMSTEPHQHRLAVGIDLGTTNSLVATVRNGVACVCRTKTARRCCRRSCITSPDGQIVVGRKAQAAQAVDPAQHDCVGQALHGARAEGRLPR
jgi:molecular chaperone HscA